MGSSAFSTHVLDRVRYEERSAREDARIKVLELLKCAVAESPIPLAEAYVFGSVVRPYAFDSHSDVDVAVHALSPRDYFSLKTHLEARVLRDVDLVELESCRFSDAIKGIGQRWTNQPM